MWVQFWLMMELSQILASKFVQLRCLQYIHTAYKLTFKKKIRQPIEYTDAASRNRFIRWATIYTDTAEYIRLHIMLLAAAHVQEHASCIPHVRLL